VVDSLRARFRLFPAFGMRFLPCFLAFFAFELQLLLSVDPRQHLGLEIPIALAMLTSAVSALLPAWLLGFFRGRVVIGTDGFATRWFLRERYIPFSKIASVTPKNHLLANHLVDTVVELTSGRKVRLRAVEAPNTEAERGAEGRALFTHVAAAFERSKHPTDGVPDVRALVERGSRSAREWLTSIDAIVGDGGARYRVASLSHDSLLAVATDANASIDARVGAAAALVRTNDEDLRVRVRVCAESCTDRALSEAMLALSEARDDEATEAALASIHTT
jgi:hypothetical protein